MAGADTPGPRKYGQIRGRSKRFQESLGCATPPTRDGLPAGLVASYGRCLVLRDEARRDDLRVEARDFASNLSEARWPLSRAEYMFYLGEACSWLPTRADTSSGAARVREALSDGVDAVWQDWRARIETLFPVIGCSSMQRAPNVFLHAMLIGGFLELDISFQSPGSLIARRERWKVAFDRTGQIEQSIRESWASRNDPDMKAIYLDNVKGIWHYIMHVAVATRRGQVWRAISDLELIRDRAVDLAGLRLRAPRRA